nr:polyprotein [Phytophthora heveae alphaendornavirus 1]
MSEMGQLSVAQLLRRPPQGDGNKKLKINRNNVQLFRLGVEGPGIPVLSLKHCLYKRDMYIDCAFGDMYSDGHTNSMGITELMNIYHNNQTYDVDKPFNKQMFNADQFSWRPEDPINAPMGKMEYKPPFQAPPVSSSYNFVKFRRQLIKYVRNKSRRFTGNRADLLGFLSSRSNFIYSGTMVERSRISHGQMQLYDGYYIKCNCCGALSYIPIINMVRELPVPLNKDQICTLLEKLQNKEFNEEGMLDLDMEVYGFELGMLCMMFENAKIDCFNCDKSIFESSHKTVYEVFSQVNPYDYGINGVTIELFKKMLYLDNPPPEDMPESRKVYDKIKNQDMQAFLQRVDRSYAHVNFKVDVQSNAGLFQRLDNIRFAANQNLSEQSLGVIEIEEVLLLSEISAMFNNTINISPSSLNIAHALNSGFHCLYDSPFFECTELPFTNTKDPQPYSLISAFPGIDMEAAVQENNFILVYNFNAVDYNLVHGHAICSPVTGCNFPALWSIQMSKLVSLYAGCEIRGDRFDFQTIRSTEHFQVVRVVKPSAKPTRLLIGTSHLRVKLPVIDTNSVVKTVGLFGTRWDWMEVNVDLARRIIINAISGKKSIDALLSYIAGTTSTKYSVGGKLVDLTSVALTDGLPELTYALVVLHDQERLVNWVKLNVIGGINVRDVQTHVYEVLSSKILQLIRVTLPSAYENIEKLFVEKHKLSFKRDSLILRQHQTPDLNSILPYKVLTRISTINSNYMFNVTSCVHHEASCVHEYSSKPCMCCGLAAKENSPYCECCLPADTEEHSCMHVCKGTHFCALKNATGNCNHAGFCDCCKLPHCFEFCMCCSVDVEVVEVERPVTSLKKTASKSSKPDSHDRARPNIQVPNLGQVPSTHTKKGKVLAKLTFEGETYNVRKIQNIKDPEELFVTTAEGSIYCPFRPLRNEVAMSHAGVDEHDIIDAVAVSESCAIECIVRQSDYTFNEVCSLTGYKTEHSLTDILSICQQLKLNVIVIYSNNAMVVARNASITDKYMVITHTEAVLGSRVRGHWCISTLPKLTTLPNGFWCNIDFSTTMTDALNGPNTFHTTENDQKTFINTLKELMRTELQFDGEVALKLPTVKQIGDEYFFSNSATHQIQRGDVNIKIPNEYAKLLESASNFDTVQIDVLATTATHKVSTSNKELIHERLVDTIREYGTIRGEILSGRGNVDINFDAICDASSFVLPQSAHVYKALELVRVRYEDGSSVVAVTRKHRSDCVITGLKQKISGFTTFKTSIASLIRKMCILIDGLRTVSNYDSLQIIKNVNGIGGTGKTTWIMNHVSRDAAIVCKLRATLPAFKSKGFKFVGTLEQFLLERPNVAEIALDESTLTDAVEFICLAIHPHMKISLFGDQDQVGVVEFSKTPGWTALDNAQDFCGVEVENWTETYRFGEPLVTEVLKNIYPTITSKSDHSTTYEFNKFTKLKDLVELITSANVDTVYVFYSHVEAALRHELENEHGIVIRKVHANQGTEGNRVLVVYSNFQPSPSGILLDRKYVTTALTRAKSHLIVATDFTSITDINMMIDVCFTGAGGSVSRIFSDDGSMIRELSLLEIPLINNFIRENVSNIDNYSVSPDSIKLDVNYSGVIIKVLVDTHGIHGRDLKSKMILSGRKHLVTRELLKIQDEQLDMNPEFIDEEVFFDTVESDQQPDDILEVKHSKMIQVKNYRLSLLAWNWLTKIADATLLIQHASGAAYLKLRGETIQVKCFNGCSLFTGFKLNSDKIGECTISSAHVQNGDSLLSNLNSHVRTFSGNTEMIQFLLTTIKDQAFLRSQGATTGNCVKRIIERTKTMLKHNTCNMGCCAEHGMSAKHINQALYDSFESANLGIIRKINFQPIPFVVYVDRESRLAVFPNHVYINTINDLMRLSDGIQGMDEGYEVNIANRQMMDKILVRKLQVERAGIKQCIMPERLFNEYMHTMDSVINQRQIIKVPAVTASDSFADFIDCLALNYIYKILNVRHFEVRGVDSKIHTLQNLEGVVCNVNSLDVQSKTIFDVVHTSKIEHLKKLIDQTTVKEIKDKLTHDLQQEECHPSFLCDDNTLPTSVYYNANQEVYQSHEHVYFIKVDADSPHIIQQHGHSFLLGETSNPLAKRNAICKHVELWRFGHYALCKMVSTKTIRLQWSPLTTRKIRRFTSPMPSMEIIDIPSDIYRKLLSRALYDTNVSVDDMLAYSRSMLSTMVYSSTGVTSSIATDMSQMMQYIAVVMNVVSRNRAHAEAVKSYLSTGDDGGIMSMLIQTVSSRIKTWLAEQLDEIGLPEMLSAYTEYYDTHAASNSILHKIIAAFKDVDIVEVHPTCKLIAYQGKAKDHSIIRQTKRNCPSNSKLVREEQRETKHVPMGISSMGATEYQESGAPSQQQRQQGKSTKQLDGKNIEASHKDSVGKMLKGSQLMGDSNIPLDVPDIPELEKSDASSGSEQNDSNSEDDESDDTSSGLETPLEQDEFNSSVLINGKIIRDSYNNEFSRYMGLYYADLSPIQVCNCNEYHPDQTLINEYLTASKKLWTEARKWLEASDYIYTITKGTLIAALRTGKLSQPTCNVRLSGGGTKIVGNMLNWVDSDYDILVFVRKNSRVSAKAVIKSLADYIKLKPLYRGATQATAILHKKLRKPMPMAKHSNVWSVITEHCGGIHDVVSIDVGVVMYDDDYAYVQDEVLASHFGLSDPAIIPTEVILPSPDNQILLEGNPVSLPGRWDILLSFYNDKNASAVDNVRNLMMAPVEHFDNAAMFSCNKMSYNKTAFLMILDACERIGQSSGFSKWLELEMLVPTTFDFIIFETQAKEAKVHTMCAMFAGSRGDHIPMLNFVYWLKNWIDITCLVPSDFSITLPHEVTEVRFEVDSSHFVHGGGKDNSVIKQNIKYVSEVLSRTNSVYDVVVGPFFCNEVDFIPASQFKIKLWPVIINPYKNIPLIKQPLRSLILKTFSVTNNVETLDFACVPKAFNPVDKSLGWALSPLNFESDDVTVKVIQAMSRTSDLFTVVSFGSMQFANYKETIENILTSETGPFLLCCNYSHQDGSIHFNNTTYNLDELTFTRDLIVVKTCNFYLLKPYVKKLIHHGGCGTLLTGYFWAVEQKIHPIAYEQFDNAKYYLENKAPILNIEECLNSFQHEVLNLFGLKSKYTEYKIPNAVLTRLALPTTDTIQVRKSIKVMHGFVTDMEIQKISVSTDCVLLSLQLLFPDLADHVSEVYRSWQQIMDFTSVSDIVCLVLTLQVSVHIVHSGESIIVEIDDSSNDAALIISEDLRHCDAGHVVTANVPHVSEMISPMEVTVPGVDNLTFLSKVVQVFSKSDFGETALEKVLLAVLSKNPTKLSFSLIRKSKSCYLPKIIKVSAGAVVVDNLPPFYTWQLLTNVGVIPAVSLKSSDGSTTILYTGFSSVVVPTIAFRYNNFESHLVVKGTQKAKSWVKACINQTTLNYCRSKDIPVFGVASEPVSELYVYNTWNRKHHLEKEREVIMHSENIRVVPSQLSMKWLRLLKTLTKHKVIILKGKPHFAVELSNKQPSREVTKKFYASLAAFETIALEDVVLLKNITSEEIALLDERMTFAEDDVGAPQVAYPWVLNTTPLEMGTIEEMFDQVNVDLDDWKAQIIAEEFHIPVNEVHQTIVVRCERTGLRVSTALEILATSEFCNNGILSFSKHWLHYKLQPVGAGQDHFNEANAWHTTERQHRSENKFDVVTASSGTSRSLNTKVLLNMLHLTSGIARESEADMFAEVCRDAKLIEFYKMENGEHSIELQKVDNIPDLSSQDYWDTSAELQDHTIILPSSNQIKMRGRLEPGDLTKCIKLAMEQYPIYARPSITKDYLAEFNSFSNRQGQVKRYAFKNFDIESEHKMFVANYFIEDFSNLSSRFQTMPVNFDFEASVNWVKQHNYPEAVIRDLERLFDEGFESRPLAYVEVHPKTEQTTKMNKFSRWYNEVVSRSIVASVYSVAALFSPPFLELKKRFKDALRDGVIYADGMTPEQLGAYLRTRKPCRMFIEDDLTQQDGQTSMAIIELEFIIYHDLGLDPHLSEMYKSCHMSWRWKGHGISGLGDAMRLTGQVTTALGNAITNLIVHNRFMVRNRNHIDMMAFLGDDVIFTSDHALNVSNHGTETKDIYNMVSKVTQRELVGGFLSMIVHNVGGIISVCPHFKRMRHRYSVCNYSFSGAERETKIKSRALSYCFMLGNLKESKDIASSITTGVNIPDWFDWPQAIEANALYDDSNVFAVQSHVGSLCSMLKNFQPIEHEFAIVGKPKFN